MISIADAKTTTSPPTDWQASFMAKRAPRSSPGAKELQGSGQTTAQQVDVLVATGAEEPLDALADSSGDRRRNIEALAYRLVQQRGVVQGQQPEDGLQAERGLGG
jgi:hypothetical protein